MLKYPPAHHIEQNKTCTLDNLLEHYRSGICDVEDLKCDFCNRRTVATRHDDIRVYPKFLVIVLCQRIANGNTKNINNVNTGVEFPLENLCPSLISNVQEQLVDLSYNLIGTVNHKASGGHYTAIIKKADHWHCYNDEEVTNSNFSFLEKTGH